MSPVGPSLPPTQVKKRKCEAEVEAEDETEADHDEAGLQSTPSTNGRPASPPSSAKRPRTIGPTLPPASLDEQPSHSPAGDAESSSGDDEFGPSLPTATSSKSVILSNEPLRDSAAGPQAPAGATASNKRDEWMIVPPSSGDWSARVDPTKLKSRKFNTGKGAKGPTQTPGRDNNANWTETPDEKRLRLHQEIMGIKNTSTPETLPENDAKARENARKLHEFNEKSRGPTLYKEHQGTNPQENEDDPSARAFDREKDVAGGIKINHTQRREMMNKAADFGSRFSSGKFL